MNILDKTHYKGFPDRIIATNSELRGKNVINQILRHYQGEGFHFKHRRKRSNFFKTF